MNKPSLCESAEGVFVWGGWNYYITTIYVSNIVTFIFFKPTVMKKISFNNPLPKTVCFLLAFFFYNLIVFKSYSQCSCEPFSYASYVINPTISQTADDFDVAGDDWSGTTVLLQYDFVIDVDFTINNTDIAIKEGKKIIVNDGVTLTIQGGSYLNAKSGDDPWQGIQVLSGGAVVSNHCIISNAVIGLEIFNDPDPGNFTVNNNSIFCNNTYGVKVNAYSGGLHPGSIEDTRFCAPDPLSGVAYAGIWIENVYDGGSINIGNGSLFSPTSGYNTFSSYERGIAMFNVDATITNNYFEGLDEAIYGIGEDLDVQSFVQIGSSDESGIYNSFKSNTWSIVLVIYSSLIVQNEFNGIASGNTSDMNSAINSYYSDGSTNYIIDNIINNADLHGIISLYNTNTFLAIRGNEINNSMTLPNTYERIGIWVEPYLGGTNTVDILSNTISGVQKGIFVRGVDDYLNISYNDIDFKYPSGSTGDASGIQIENCYFAKIGANTMNGHGSASSKTHGIHIEECEGFRCYFDNYITSCGYGIYCDQDSPIGNIVCNRINNCTYGVAFNDVNDSNIGPIQGNFTSPYYPSDNKWTPSTGSASTWANRTVMTGGTDGGSMTWRYRDVASIYDMDEAGGTGLNVILTGGVALSPVLSTAGPTGSDICDEGEYDELPRLNGYVKKPDITLNAQNYNITKITDDLDLEGYFAMYYANLSAKLDAGATINDLYLLLDAGLHHLENDSLVIEPDSTTEHLQSLIAETNLQNYRDVCSLIRSEAFEGAGSLLSEIIPINIFEENMSTVLNIYMQSIDSSGKIIVGDENKITLLDIAVQKNNDAGKAVYIARSLLDTIITFPAPEIAGDEELKINLNPFSVHPNPNSGKFIVELPSSYKDGMMTITDLTGTVLYAHQITLSPDSIYNVDISAHKPGIYIFIAENVNGEIKRTKIIKL